MCLLLYSVLHFVVFILFILDLVCSCEFFDIFSVFLSFIVKECPKNVKLYRWYTQVDIPAYCRSCTVCKILSYALCVSKTTIQRALYLSEVLPIHWAKNKCAQSTSGSRLIVLVLWTQQLQWQMVIKRVLKQQDCKILTEEKDKIWKEVVARSKIHLHRKIPKNNKQTS